LFCNPIEIIGIPFSQEYRGIELQTKTLTALTVYFSIQQDFRTFSGCFYRIIQTNNKVSCFLCELRGFTQPTLRSSA
jgi:hypothetical protein